MLNYIWATLLFIGLLVAGLVGRVSGDASVIDAAMKGAEKAVMGIALPLAVYWLESLKEYLKRSKTQSFSTPEASFLPSAFSE